MKKILLAVTAALAITSCSQNEEFEAPSQKAEINFNTAVTRATAMTTDRFAKFEAYGYAHTDAFTTETQSEALVEGLFEKGSEGKWAAEGEKKFYWPSEGNVTFFAYSPVGETGTVYTVPASSKGYPTITYTVNDNIASQSDFLIAQETGDGTTNKDGISLGFKHALTQIAFKLKGSDSNVEYSVAKLVLKGIKNVGTYKWEAKEWEPATGTKDYTIEMGSAVTFVGDEENATELTGNDKVLMLIPQAPSGAKIEVTYTATDKTTGIVYNNNAPKEVDVPTTQWVVSQRIVFTIALTPGKIMNISGDVTDGWLDKAPQPGDLE